MNNRLALALSVTMISHPLTDADRATADRVAAKVGVPAMSDSDWATIRDGLTVKADTSAWPTGMIHAAARVSSARARRIGVYA